MHHLQDPVVSVLMPTYGQSAFIERAIDSLRAQSLSAWELVVVDANRDDETARRVGAIAGADDRVRLMRMPEAGLGHALNVALDAARAPLVAYLPSDDVWYRDHLQSLVALLEERPDAVLAHAGVRHHYNREVPAEPPGEPLQLVQCVHRKVDARWIERDDLETDDLDHLYWQKLREAGAFIGSGRVTCEWVDHPAQRHKLMREPTGGINPFRVHYRVQTPLRFKSTVGNLIDEPGQYAAARTLAAHKAGETGLRIVLVGELAYNADRVL